MRASSSLAEVRVLLLTWHGTAILPVLRSLGPEVARIVLLHGFPNGVVSRSVHARPFVRFEPDLSDEDVCATVLRVADQFGCSVLFPADDLAVHFVSRCREVLAQAMTITPNPSVEALGQVGCKVRFNRLLQMLDIDHPRSVEAARFPSPTTEALHRLRPPWMVKAGAMSGGHGIIRCETETELTAACERMQAQQIEFMVQEWVSGPDLDCSFLARDGQVLAWTTQRSLKKGDAFAPATEIVVEPHPELLALVSRLSAHLKWNGLAHVDGIRDDRDGSYRLLELNPRCWGSLLASTAAGVNFPKLLVQTALGHSVGQPAFSPRRFYTGGLGLRRTLGVDGQKWSIGETDVPYFLEDPWPELAARNPAGGSA